MKKHTFAQKFRYKFDNLMSKGPIAMISLLAILSILIVIVSGSIIYVFHFSPEGDKSLDFSEGLWQSLMRALDAGAVGADSDWTFRLIAFIVTVGGIFILSTLIGVLSSGIESKLDDLRKGKSLVIEKNHTLILGWSTKIFTIISELIIANENSKNPRIVILADMDKVEMEDEIRNKIENFKNTKVICRKGNPNDLVELDISNPQQSKSIIILASDIGNSDPLTIKTILAITNNPERRNEPYHIVAEIKDVKNVEVAKMVGKNEIEIILTDDVIGRIIVQTSRQSGLSIVYTELMDFDGAEIYFGTEESLIGKTYGEAIFSYKDSTVLGLQHADNSLKINPSMDYKLIEGDKIIAITEDDDTLIVSANSNNQINEELIQNLDSSKIETERILLLGWNKRAMVIIREMDKYVAPNSYMKIVSSFDSDEENIQKIAKTLKNIKLEFQIDDTTSREVIDELDITSYDSIQVLCYKEEMEIQDADAQTLITLLHIRRICEETGKDMKIVSEMLDLRNRNLAEVTKADDFIVSDELISLLMSQVSENKFLMDVFDDLFNESGSEIYLKPIEDYIKLDQEMNFYTILESAKRKGHTAIGYRVNTLVGDNTQKYGIVLNPDKSKVIKFSKNDRIIVLAED